MSNLSILEQNICNSLYHEDESIMFEARDLFMRCSVKDQHPFYKAEQCARDWLRVWGLLGKVLNAPQIMKMYDAGEVYPEVRQFLRKRLENMYWSNS